MNTGSANAHSHQVVNSRTIMQGPNKALKELLPLSSEPWTHTYVATIVVSNTYTRLHGHYRGIS